MRGAISVAIALSTILVVDGFIQPKLGRGVTLVSSRKSLCPSGIRPLIQTARPIKWRQENGPYGRGLCTFLMAADRKDDKVRFGFPKMLRRIVPFFAVRFRPVAAEVHLGKKRHFSFDATDPSQSRVPPQTSSRSQLEARRKRRSTRLPGRNSGMSSTCVCPSRILRHRPLRPCQKYLVLPALFHLQFGAGGLY